MDLKESLISSFFFHLILLLFMAAVASFTTGLSGSPRNIVPVDLVMEEGLPDTGTDSAEEPPLTSISPPSEEVSLSKQAVEESKETPEPEKKAEVIAEPAKIETAEKPPAQTGGFPSMEAYYQFIMMHKKIFGQKAGARVSELLGEALKVNKREFYGGTAIVSLKFGPDGSLSEVHVESASPELKAFFEEIIWSAVPAPAEYSLGFTGVQIEFTVLEGYMSFKIDAF
jgi:outer membrane biosynthesis protein TonB